MMFDNITHYLNLFTIQIYFNIKLAFANIYNKFSGHNLKNDINTTLPTQKTVALM